MERVYLKDGEEVVLHEKLGNGSFVIEQMYHFEGYEGETFTEGNGVKIVVPEIFKSAPVAKKHNELIELIDKVQKKNQELKVAESQLRDAKTEALKVTNQKTDLSKFIINRQEWKTAETLTVFDGFRPKTMSEKDRKSLKLSVTISVVDGGESSWVYTLYGDSWSGGDRINEDVGVLVNASDDEILEAGKRIVLNAKEINDYVLKNRIPHEYLTQELIDRKNKILANEKKSEIAKIEASINKDKRKLQELKSK